MKINSWTPRTHPIISAGNATSKISSIFMKDLTIDANNSVVLEPTLDLSQQPLDYTNVVYYNELFYPRDYNAKLFCHWNSSTTQGNYPVNEDGWKFHKTSSIWIEDDPTNPITAIDVTFSIRTINIYGYEEYKDEEIFLETIPFTRTGNLIELDMTKYTNLRILSMQFFIVTEQNDQPFTLKRISYVREANLTVLEDTDPSLNLGSPFSEEGWPHDFEKFYINPGASPDKEKFKGLLQPFGTKVLLDEGDSVLAPAIFNDLRPAGIARSFYGRNPLPKGLNSFIEMNWNTSNLFSTSVPRYKNGFYNIGANTVLLRDDETNRITRVVALTYDRYTYNIHGYGYNNYYNTEIEFVRDGDVLILDTSEISKHLGHRMILCFAFEKPDEPVNLSQLTFVGTDHQLILAHLNANKPYIVNPV